MTSSSAADTPSVLTAVVCVVRAGAPALLALDHVIQLLDQFLDVSVLWSLPQAAASGSVYWFDRVYRRIFGASASASPLQINEDPLAELTLSNAMLAAVEYGHMAIVQRIHALHPKRLSVRLLSIAAADGDLELFQWLLAHRNDDLCTVDHAPGIEPPSIESMSCCLHRAFVEAIRHEQLGIVKWLLENGYRPSKSYEKAGDVAALTGDLEMVQWLHTNQIPYSFTKHAIDDAARHGHSQVVLYLLTNRSEGFTTEAVHNAVIGGYDDIHEVLRLSGVLPVAEFEALGKWAIYTVKAGRLDLLESPRYVMEDARLAMLYALQYGHLEAVEWLWHRYKVEPDGRRAALHGHLHILQWMHHHNHYQMLGCSSWDDTAMDCAARNGHLTVVQWLYENREEGCTTKAMDGAAKNGHLEMVQWLHDNRQEGCTTNAMTLAAMSGHLQIVEWLHIHRTEGCTANAMDLAAAHNHLKVVEWFHVHRTEGCTTQAMDEAARNGYLEMVIWLHDHGQDDVRTPVELRCVPFSVLKWLHFNGYEGFSTAVMDDAANRGEMATLAFLHQHRTEGCSNNAATSAASHGHLPIVQWLTEKYPRQFDAASVASHARDNGHRHIVQWLEDEQLIPMNQ